MKHLLSVLILISACYSAEWDDPALPMADVEKPVYQWTGWPPPGNMWFGGKCSKVRIPSTDELKQKLEYEYEMRLQNENIKQIKRADNLMLYGLIGIIACAVAHGFSSLPMLKRVAEYGIVGGVVSVLGGIGYKFLIKNEVALEWIFGITLGIFLIYKVLTHDKVRDWSISHLFKKKG